MESVSFYLKKAYLSGHTLLLRYLRRLAREFVIFAPVVFLAFIVLNFWPSQTPFETSKAAIIRNPYDFKNRLTLAKILVDHHNYQEAHVELQKIPNSSETQTVVKAISLQTNSPLVIQDNITFWQSVSQKNPSFRDALVKSALLNWKIYRPFEAKKLLGKALTLDPNNQLLQDLAVKLK